MSFLENLVAKLTAKATERMEVYETRQALIRAYDANTAGDLATALKGFEAAAEIDGHAAMMAGEMYVMGRGTKVNAEKGIKYLEMAVAAGQEPAVALLGLTYSSGKSGFKIDYVKAKPLLERAAKNGDKDCQKVLDLIKAKQRGRR